MSNNMKRYEALTQSSARHLKLLAEAVEKLMAAGYKVCMLTEPSFVDLIAINKNEIWFVEVKAGKSISFTPNEKLVQKLCKMHKIKYSVYHNNEFHEL